MDEVRMTGFLQPVQEENGFTIRFEMKGIAAATIADYLGSLGGVLNPEGWFVGPGWQARITPRTDQNVGRLAFERLWFEWQGDAAAAETIWPRFRLKIMRPGG
jgi:hypothetical protein